MDLEIKRLKELYCPKCGGELSLEESKAIGVCQHCESAFLLTDEEIAILRKQDIENTSLRTNYIDIVSHVCATYYKPWDITPDNFFVSGSMRHSFLHKNKMKKVKKYFDIPEEDDVFLIVDTGLKSYTSGLTLCTSGLYYIESNHNTRGILTWIAFKNAKIVAAGKDVLLIDDLYFSLFSSPRDIAHILKRIQQNI